MSTLKRTLPTTGTRPKVRKLMSLMEQHIQRNDGKPSHWKIEDFEYGMLMGSGTFGKVVLARERSTHLVCAIKVIDKININTYYLKKQLINEICIHKKLRHPNIITLFTYFHNDTHLFLVLEYASNGTVHNYMLQQTKERFDNKLAAKFVYQVSSALQYCHDLNIIHRDLKPENLLLDTNIDVKLSDFGWACHCSHAVRKVCGTNEYFSPELVEHKRYGKPVDRWSVGCLCYELLAGVNPFHCKDIESSYEKIVNVKFSYPKHFSSEAKDLISRLLVYNPSKRIPLNTVMSHSWIKNNYRPE